MTPMARPVLHTSRFILRPFTEDDIPEVARLAGDRRIAEFTVNVPHPYSEDDARTWIGTHADGFEKGTLVNFAITDREAGALIGSVGLVVNRAHRRAELGYWVAVAHWNRGVATEAALAVLRYAFEELDLIRVEAMHLSDNVASGRVMEKIGMVREGVRRKHWKRRFAEGYDDIEFRGILADEFNSSPDPDPRPSAS
jgi:RimJ/RimL family protein N-acetyltransferase